MPVFSQLSQSAYIDVGSNSMSSGIFGRAAYITAYRISNYEARVGLQASTTATDQSVFSGLFVDVSGDYAFREFPISVSLFFRYNPYSALISETNFGLIASHSRDHLEVHLGYDSRIYSMHEGETDLSDLPDPDMHIYEWRNFMYKGILWLKPMDHTWNLGGSLTNCDDFLIQQETNPMLTGLFKYSLKADWKIYSELWYQGAGMLNLSANHYGFYFRAGFIWQID